MHVPNWNLWLDRYCLVDFMWLLLLLLVAVKSSIVCCKLDESFSQQKSALVSWAHGSYCLLWSLLLECWQPI